LIHRFVGIVNIFDENDPKSDRDVEGDITVLDKNDVY